MTGGVLTVARPISKNNMELDLDSFLQSDDDEEEDSNDNNNRTVDEILLNHSSSASPSPPSSPSTSNDYFSPRGKQQDSIDVPNLVSSPSKTRRSVLSSSLSHSHSADSSKFNLITRIKSNEFSSGDSSFSSKLSSNTKSNDNLVSSSSLAGGSGLPPLFGGVRSAAKPGAALAAAAAASRSVPTPYAAAIKLRRASTGALQKGVLDSVEQLSSPDGSASVVSSGAAVSEGADLTSEISNQLGDGKSDCFQSVGVEVSEDAHSGEDVRGEDSRREYLSEDANVQHLPLLIKENLVEEISCLDKEHEVRVCNAEEVLPCSSSYETHVDYAVETDKIVNSADDSASSVLDEIEDKHLDFNFLADEIEDKQVKLSLLVDDTNDASLNLNDVSDNKDTCPSISLPEEDKVFDRNATDKKLETHDQEYTMSQPKDDDSSSSSDTSDIVEALISQWESKNGGKKRQKTSRSSLKLLELAEEIEKRQASTSMHWEEGVAAQPMRLEGVRKGSTVLGYFDVNGNNKISRTMASQAFRREHGSPQVLAVHLNHIAVGMSRGVILVQPSKYSPHHPDNMEAKMSMLGLQGDRSQVPVTSICFNQQGDLLFAGYGDGHYTVWDVQRASALKVITEHKAPVVHILYLGQDTQVTRQFNVVSGDSKGVVKLIRFTVVPWVNRISYSKSMKLLDETTSTVVCASPLVSCQSHGGSFMSSQVTNTASSGIGSMMGGVVGGDSGWKLFEGSFEEGVVIFVTHQSALVAKVSPSVEVYAQLPKPDGVREGSMPYAAWRCNGEYRDSSENASVETSERIYLLAIAWDRKVQIAKLVKSDLKTFGNWMLDSPAVGVAWLDDQMLVILTLAGQLCLFTKDGNMIHQTSFAVEGSRGDELISYHTYFNNVFGNPEKAHHNCVAIRGASIYILAPGHLVVSRLLPWKERIEVLRKAGDWMGALNMAMSLYDGQSHGVVDLPRALDDVQQTVMPYLVELLSLYVDEVFSYLSVASCTQTGNSEQSDEIKEQYARVGGVTVEFCVHIKRTDILFDDIYSKFVSKGHGGTFLELLEPYILKDVLGSLPPEIMQELVSHYSTKGWLQRVEQCVLHMDMLSLDFNQVIRLCREHRLYGALIYLFNKGLDDFRAPLDELLDVFQKSQGKDAAALGYRMLVYMKYCFEGLAFPPGHGTLPPTRLSSLRKELLQFLLENSSASGSWPVANLPSGSFINLHHLLQLDTEATLDVIRCAFVEIELPKKDSSDINMSSDANDSVTESLKLLQKLIDALSGVLPSNGNQTATSISNDDGEPIESWPAKKDVGHMIEFIAYYVGCERAKVSKDILSQILEYLTSDINLPPAISGQIDGSSKKRERQLLTLLEVIPETDWDAPYVLHLCEKAQFHQVCGSIFSARQQYLDALSSYMRAVHEPIHAFSFIHDMLQKLSGQALDAFHSAVISRIPDLIKLSREGTFFLILYHFSGQSQNILSELRSCPESLFLYLKTIMEVHSTGKLNFSCVWKDSLICFPGQSKARHQIDRVQAYLESVDNFPRLMRENSIQVTDEMTELYLELLCRYERESVLKFLETLESYRVEHCLRLCQEYGIIDAAAFLLERVGDVGSALLLILSGLNDKFILLDAAIGLLNDYSGHFDGILKIKEVNDIMEIVRASIGLCQRNSPRIDPDESELIWFQLLDSFCEPLVDSNHMFSSVETSVKLVADSSGNQSGKQEHNVKWKVSKAHKAAHILRRLFSVFVKEIVEGMIGYVRLPTIMLKLLSDNGSQEFGDFKLTILGMLGIYDFERRILVTAKSLIEDDSFYTMSLLKKGASHGYAPRSSQCCICNSFFTKSSTSSGIQVFACGHATHLQCELQESEASLRGSSAGCPICMPGNKAQTLKSKSILAENGLLSKSSFRSRLAQKAVAMPLHDNDVSENSYDYHPISRFELLNNLQKDQGLIEVENTPQLRLAPPAVYHEKVKKGSDLSMGESSSGLTKIGKAGNSKQLSEVKVRTSRPFTLKTKIFGKEKSSKR